MRTEAETYGSLPPDYRAAEALLDPSQLLVSVGIPAYNRPEGLRRALEGLLAQTHRNLEIIVSDNASPDPRVQEVLREFEARDPRVKGYRQAENIGFILNFRFVFEKSSSRYYMWAADDDSHHPEFVATCLRNLLDPRLNAALSFCHVVRVAEDGALVDPDYYDRAGTDSGGLMWRSFQYLRHGFKHCFYGILRREHVNGWFFAQRYGNDDLSLFTLIRHGHIHIDRRVLFTAAVGGTGFHRQNFHKYYPAGAIGMKIMVTVSSTLTLWYELLRCIWLTPYRPAEKLALSLMSVVRFSQWRYWRRAAGDVRALLTRRDIWDFKAK